MSTLLENISLANTFGEWVITTNDAVNEVNHIAFDDYHKTTGTLYLDDPTTGLIVSNNAVFHGTLEVGGTGSNLLVRQNGDVQGTLYLSNTNGNPLVLSANGIANVNYINIVGSGLSANVSNNMSIGGTLIVTGNTSVSANLIVTKDITANSGTFTRDLHIARNANVDNNLIVIGSIEGDSTLTIFDDVYFKKSLAVTGNTFTDVLQANTSANTRTLSVTGTAFANTLQANTSANTRTLSVTGTAFADVLQANTAANTRTLSVTGVTFTDVLQANTAANTRTLSVTGTAFANIFHANTIIESINVYSSGQSNLNSIVSNTTLAVTGTAYVNQLTSNNNIIANTGTVFTNVLSANSINFNTSIVGSGPISTTGAGSFGSMTVSGSFTITGATIYAANTFTLSDGSPFPSSPSAQYGTLRVSRNTANAEIRWDNSDKSWTMKDVDSLSYNRILSIADYAGINTSISTANTNNILYTNAQITANAVSANAVISTANTSLKSYVDNGFRTSVNTDISTANTNMKNYVDVANTSMKSYVDTANTNLKSYGDNKYLIITSSGGIQTISSDVTVTGNLIVNGTSTTINTTTIATNDSLIKLANNNIVSDSLDIGFYGTYNSTGVKYAGLFRKAADKFYLVQNVVTDPATGNTFTFSSANRSTIDANFTGGTVSGLVSAIPVADGGTGVTTSTGSGANALATSPTLVTPILGTPTSGTLTNCTGYTYANLSGTIPTWNQNTTGSSGSCTGNAATVTNGVYTTGSYANPTWITNINYSILNGTVPTWNQNTTGSAATFTSTTQNSQFNSVGVGTAGSATAGEIRATNNITAFYSDRRLKENITPINDALNKVMQISGVTFNSNALASNYGYTNKSIQVGVIAQEIEAVLPQIVVPAPFDIGQNEDGSEFSISGENYKTVQYEKIVPLLIEAIKELNLEIQELKKLSIK